MTVIRRSDAPVWELPGWQMVGGAAPSRGSSEICAWWVTVEPGADGPLHRVDHEIVEMVYEGELTITVDGTATVVPAGDEAGGGERCGLIALVGVHGGSVEVGELACQR